MQYSKRDISDMEHAHVVSELPEKIINKETFENLQAVEIPEHLRDMIELTDIEHREFNNKMFWQKIPYFKDVTREEFMDVQFQNQNTATKVDHLDELLEDLVDPEFLEDVKKGMSEAPMNIRVSPYILSLIDWNKPYEDPLRRQFIPVASTRLEDHPKLQLDSLSEQQDSPVPGLVHRYFDKALFLPLDVCPVYCRFCTRSYAIGSDTDLVTKISFKAVPKKWYGAFAYLASRPEIEDVVVSGGDTYMLIPDRLKQIGETLLSIPHIRRIRFASKGPAVLPMKILSDQAWTDALVSVVDMGREKGKDVVLHTHFNSANEITSITRDAMQLLFKRGITVRNQSVLLKGVNDDVDEMIHLVRKLSYMNVQPYYVYQHDMVKGMEEMRTRIEDTVELERMVRGATAGFNTPLFVMDAPGGGGKRDVHSFDYYDQVTGISTYRSPTVDEDKVYLYFDPINQLPEEGQELWKNPDNHEKMIQEALEKSGYSDLKPAL